jgi:HK97 family phage major capsid protein
MPELAEWVRRRAYVAPMSTVSASPVVPSRLSDLILAPIRSASVIGKIESRMALVPFLTNVAAQRTDSTASWVGESQATPAAALAFDGIQLPAYKLAALTAYSQELFRQETPSSDATICRSLVEGVAAQLDLSFLDPASGLIAGVRPASITSGAPTVASSGSSAAQITADLKLMMAALTNWIYPVWIMRPGTAGNLAATTNASGNLQFPNISMLGGTLLGLPVIVSANAPAAIVLLDAGSVLYADENQIELDLGEEVSLLMDDGPQNSPQTTSVVSFWQRGLLSLRCTRTLSFARAHDGVVASMLVSY